MKGHNYAGKGKNIICRKCKKLHIYQTGMFEHNYSGTNENISCKKCGKFHKHTKYMCGKIPWNKGLTKEINNSVKKMSEKVSEKNKKRNLFNKGKSYEEIYGIEKAKKIKNKQSKPRLISDNFNHKGGKNGFYNKKHTQNYKDKMSEIMKIKRLKQVFPLKDTKIEVKMQNELKIRDIPFQTHYPVVGQPDIVIFNNGSKIAVFVDGCFWHGCPIHNLKYRDKAKIRDDYVNRKLEEVNWTVLRFWEHEINKNIKYCIDKIEEVLL